MLRFSKSKIIATLAVIIIGLLLGVPSMMSREERQAYLNAIPSWVPSWLVPSRAIVLGLDLQGGSQVLLEVDQADLLRTQTILLRDDVRGILRDTRVASQNGIQTLSRGVQIRVPNPADRERLMPRLHALAQPTGSAVLGQTGVADIAINEAPDGAISLTFTDAGIDAKVRRAVDQSIEVVRRRVDIVGTTEPSIQRQGADRVLVQVPGLQDPQDLRMDRLHQGRLAHAPGTPEQGVVGWKAPGEAGRVLGQLIADPVDAPEKGHLHPVHLRHGGEPEARRMPDEGVRRGEIRLRGAGGGDPLQRIGDALQEGQGFGGGAIGGHGHPASRNGEEAVLSAKTASWSMDGKPRSRQEPWERPLTSLISWSRWV